uniref:Uncharacterized protein n=1 Tax=Arundo donax TaxID=35708 RepID=A0A0A9E6L3_ARUDO
MHDVTGGPSPTAMRVVNGPRGYFGNTVVIDDKLMEGQGRPWASASGVTAPGPRKPGAPIWSCSLAGYVQAYTNQINRFHRCTASSASRTRKTADCLPTRLPSSDRGLEYRIAPSLDTQGSPHHRQDQALQDCFFNPIESHVFH